MYNTFGMKMLSHLAWADLVTALDHVTSQAAIVLSG